MAINVNLQQLATLNNTSILNQSNANFNTLQTALTDSLSLSGQLPNQMKSNLDMNSNQILNLPPPSSINSPARLTDVVTNPTIVVPPTGTSGATVPLLNGNNTWSGTNNFTAATTLGTVTAITLPSGSVGTTQLVNNSVTNAILAQASANTIKGNATGSTANVTDLTVLPTAVFPALTGNVTTTAGSLVTTIANNAVIGNMISANAVGNTQIRQGVAKSVIGVTGNAISNVADITGTTRQVLAISTAGTSLVFAQPQGDQLLGTVTNDNATAGNVGEYISSSIVSGSAVALSSGSPANVTSISLTAGDWDVWINAFFLLGATSNITGLLSSISTTTATMNFSNGQVTTLVYPGSVLGNTFQPTINVGPFRMSLASTTTVFFVAQASFTVTANISAYGVIQARRTR